MADPVAQLLQSALAGFCRIETSEAPLLTAVQALRDLLRASASTDDLTARYPQLSAELGEAIQAATMPVSSAARHLMPAEQVWLLMAAGAAGLVGSHLPELVQDRRLYVALLVTELETSLLKSAISRNGDSLARMIHMNRALSAPAPSQALH